MRAIETRGRPLETTERMRVDMIEIEVEKRGERKRER